MRFPRKTKKLEKQCVMCTALCAPYLPKNRVKEKLQNPYSHLHIKVWLSSLKNKKVGKTAQNVLCPVCVCTVLTLFVKKLVYMNVYRIQNQSSTPKISCAHTICQKIVGKNV